MRWVILLVLVVVRLAMGYQFQSVGSASPQLIETFGLSYAQVGTLVGLFLLPGIFIAIPSGALTGLITDKNLLLIGAAAMTIGSLMMGFATEANPIFFWRFVTGIGGVIFNVILTKIITDWFFEKELVLALGCMLTTWPVGIALGLMTQGPIALTSGWDAVMLTSAAVSGVSFVLVAAFYRPPMLPTSTSEKFVLRIRLPMRQLFHVSIAGAAWMLFNSSLIVLVSFAPAMLVSSGYTDEQARFATSLSMWATLVSLPLGGQLMQKMRRTSIVSAILLLLSSAAIVGLTLGLSPVSMFVGFGLLAGLPAGALMSLSSQAVTAENRGPGLGIFFTWFYIGMTLGPSIAGALRDWTDNAQAPVVFAAFMMVACAMLIGVFRLSQTLWPISNPRSANSPAP